MNMKPVTTRVAWTSDNVNALLELYGYFLQCQRDGVKYSKAQLVRELAASQGRSKGSVEAKMMNVSAVLQSLGVDWVNGYKPLGNYNKALLDQVTDFHAQSIKTA